MIKFKVKEEIVVFGMSRNDKEASFYAKGGEECVFSSTLNMNANKEFYEPLFCSDGMLYAKDGMPIYVLKWNIEMN